MGIEGKVVIVTGASSGIGESTARLLAKNGAKVVLAARRVEKLDALKAEIAEAGGSAIAVRTDVTSKEDWKNLISATTEAFGPVDALINNAGVMPLSFLKNLHVEEWELMVDVNVKGVLNGIAAILPGFLERNQGDLINISSDAGRKVFPGGAVYCGTKWAVEAITQGLRLETGNTNIRVCSIQPGATYSELGNLITDKSVLEAFGDPFRMLDSEDIARAVLYALDQPEHCSVNEVMVRAVAQRS